MSIKRISDSVRLDETVVVERRSIIGTSIVVHRAVEFSGTSFFNCVHRSISTIDGAVYGDYTSRELPAEIDGIENVGDRFDAIQAWRAQRKAEAAAYINRAFPYTTGRPVDVTGEIVMTLDEIGQ